tara:strand:- start:767 stop:877 length:111 start_codon:yes stop_codon:yes gene_type:complete
MFKGGGYLSFDLVCFAIFMAKQGFKMNLIFVALAIV